MEIWRNVTPVLFDPDLYKNSNTVQTYKAVGDHLNSMQ